MGGYKEKDILDDCLANGKIYQVTVIDDSTVHWSVPRCYGSLPSPRSHHSVLRYGTKVIMFGGFDGQNYNADLYVFDVENCTWSRPQTSGQVPKPRGGHSATLIEDRMMVIGGNDKQTEFNDMFFLDLQTYIWIAIQTKLTISKRTNHAAVRLGNSVLIFGGYCKNGGGSLRDVWKVILGRQITNTDEITVTKIDSFTTPNARYGHTITRIGTKIFVIGGQNSHDNHNDIWLVDTVELPMEATLIDYSELELKTEVGSGNFSTVLRGLYHGQVVAIKKLKRLGAFVSSKEHQKLLKEFKAEVELLSSLKHPNLVNCLGYCENPYCIVMEYLFDNLHNYLKRHRRELTELISMAFDIANGMRYLHMNNILHRDLKSFNILLDSNRNVKIADFGIARRKTDDYTMTTKGTVAWTAPEVLRHEIYDEKSDVYSYAIVLWEMITGEIPYEGMDPIQAGIAVASENLRPNIPDSCDKDWSALIQRCWHQNPKERPDFSQIMSILKAVSFS